MPFQCFKTIMQGAIQDLDAMGIVEIPIPKVPLARWIEIFRDLLASFDDVGKEGDVK